MRRDEVEDVNEEDEGKSVMPQSRTRRIILLCLIIIKF